MINITKKIFNDPQIDSIRALTKIFMLIFLLINLKGFKILKVLIIFKKYLNI